MNCLVGLAEIGKREVYRLIKSREKKARDLTKVRRTKRRILKCL